MLPSVTYPRRVATDTVLVASTASDLRVLGWLDHLREPGTETVDIGSARLGEEVGLRPERLRSAMDRTRRVLAGPRGGDLSPVYAGHRIDWSGNPWVHVTFTEAWCRLADDVRDVTVPYSEFRALDTRCAFLLRLRAAGHLRTRDDARVRYSVADLVMVTGQRGRTNTAVALQDNVRPAIHDLDRHAPSVSFAIGGTTYGAHAGDGAEPTRRDEWTRHLDVRMGRIKRAFLAHAA